MINLIRKNWILILCVMGSIVRLLYGYFYKPWSLGPDQIAWELIIEQGSFRYDHLIHYPHEGGKIIISLLANIIETFTNFSSLTISAFIIDFFIRFFQIKIVKKMFSAQVTILFGVWTVFAVPTLIPWGTVNFGLHYIAGIFPFILLLLLSIQKDTVKHHSICGFVLGLAFWFSYSNVVLIPVFFLYRIITREEFNKWIYSFLSLSIVLLAHLLVRLYADQGFQLVGFGITSIRDTNFSINNIDFMDRLLNIPHVISNALTALPHSSKNMFDTRIICYPLFLLSLIGFFLSNRKNIVYIILSTVVLFLILYLFSPFFNLSEIGNHISFRHLSYVVPLIALFIIVGLTSFRYRLYIQVLFIVLGIYQSSLLFTMDIPKNSDITMKASGWILGLKLGHDKEALIPILKDNPEKQKLLVQGIGWGMSNAFFNNVSLDDPNLKTKVDRLVLLFFDYPISYHRDLITGIQYGFSENVKPRLNKELLKLIEKKIYETSLLKTR